MHAWRVHRHGEPGDVFELDEIPEPTAADLEGLGMHMSGWVPVQPGIAQFDDWVIMDVSFAALALPDVTMARGSYPVPVAMPSFRDGRANESGVPGGRASTSTTPARERSKRAATPSPRSTVEAVRPRGSEADAAPAPVTRASSSSKAPAARNSALVASAVATAAIVAARTTRLIETDRTGGSVKFG